MVNNDTEIDHDWNELWGVFQGFQFYLLYHYP